MTTEPAADLIDRVTLALAAGRCPNCQGLLAACDRCFRCGFQGFRQPDKVTLCADCGLPGPPGGPCPFCEEGPPDDL